MTDMEPFACKAAVGDLKKKVILLVFTEAENKRLPSAPPRLRYSFSQRPQRFTSFTTLCCTYTHSLSLSLCAVNKRKKKKTDTLNSSHERVVFPFAASAVLWDERACYAHRAADMMVGHCYCCIGSYVGRLHSISAFTMCSFCYLED